MDNALKISNSYIYRALLKDGHSTFSLEILEYCSPDKCLEREDLYLSSLKPEYNINKKATAPFSGRTHSDKTKQILSDANTSLFCLTS
jgi:group I intron endonuclease